MTTNTDPQATTMLSQARSVGQGFNIFGTRDKEGLIRPLLDHDAADTYTFTLLGKDFLVPSFITAVQDTSGYDEGTVFESREGFQNNVAAHLGVQGGVGAFSGEMALDYSGEFIQNTQYLFAYRVFYGPIATLEINDPLPYMFADFGGRVADLPTEVSPENLTVFGHFFEDFGVYYTQKAVLGGSLEFYVAISRASGLSKQNIDAMFSAQLTALFDTGSLEADVTASVEWQSYARSASHHTRVRANGGSLEAIGAIQNINPLSPDAKTVDAYSAWLKSAQSEPAIVDYRLAGIWELCGDKGDALQEAWQRYGDVLRPRLTIQTQSQSAGSPGAPQPPVITLGRQLKPDQAPDSPMGFQVVVLAKDNVTDPSAIRLNRYYTVPSSQSWQDSMSYRAMYDEMARDLSSGGITSDDILILASFGLDGQAVVDTSLALSGRLYSAGAGDQLRLWQSEGGSTPSTGPYWVNYPTDYVLVGTIDSGSDSGVESLTYAAGGTPSVSTSVEVFLYRQSFDGSYTLGLGVQA